MRISAKTIAYVIFANVPLLPPVAPHAHAFATRPVRIIVPLAAGGLVSLWFLLSEPHHPWMMQAHSYGWMALLALAVVGAINPRWVRRA